MERSTKYSFMTTRNILFTILAILWFSIGIVGQLLFGLLWESPWLQWLLALPLSWAYFLGFTWAVLRINQRFPSPKF